MPAKGTSQRNLLDQIDELKRKIQLIDGQRQAYYEETQQSMEKNKKNISELKRKNKELRKANAEKLAADEKEVKAGLKQNPEESKALKSKPGDVAIVLMDDKVQDQVRALNTAKYVTRRKQEYLDSLKKRKQQQQRGGWKQESGKENKRGGDDTDEDDTSDNNIDNAEAERIPKKDDDQAKRNLENQLDKIKLKCKEAEHIQRTYQQIRANLEDEQQTFENTLDELDREIQRLKHQLEREKKMEEMEDEKKKNLVDIYNDAKLKRDKAKEELSILEAAIQKDRKDREYKLEELRQERQKQDLQQRTRAARLTLGQDVISEQRQITGMSEDDQDQMLYESSFGRMKQAAGISDTRKLVERFKDQGDKSQELKDLMQVNEQKIEELTEKKEKLQKEYDEKKYTGEEAITSGEKLVEAEEKRAAEEEEQREEALEELKKASKLLTGVKSGIEHLVEKLKSFKEEEENSVETSSSEQGEKDWPGADKSTLLAQLSICDRKLGKIMEELSKSGQEEAEMNKKMKENDFYTTTELKLPAYNTRVQLPTISNYRDYGDDNMSGDEDEVLTRQALKKQSQQIIDSKTRRRPNKRKKRLGKY